MNKYYNDIGIFLIIIFLFIGNESIAQVQYDYSTDSIRTLGIKAMHDYMRERFSTPSKQSSENLMNNYHAEIIERKIKNFSLTQNNHLDTIEMFGKLDGLNTYTRLSESSVWENKYYQFIPMESISIVNKGNNPIYAPRLIINNERNWYNTDNFQFEAIGERESLLDKNTILHMWSFLKNNREHWYPPGYDALTSYRMLSIYGYTMCDGIAAVCRLLAWRNGSIGSSFMMTHHTVAELSDGTKSSVIDPDMEVFYLCLDNNTLAGIDEISTDKFLINRTKHFGKNIQYNKEVDAWVKHLYYSGWYRSSPNYPISSFDFLLKPHESIHFNYKKALQYYHNWDGITYIPDSFLDYFVSNSKYNLSTKFDSLSFKNIFEEFDNIQFSEKEDSYPALYTTGKTAYFIYRVNMPFPLLDAYLKGTFSNRTVNDSIQMFLSLDSENTWKKIWTSSNSGVYEDSVHIGKYFPNPLPNMTIYPPYRYSLKFVLCPSDSFSTCGLDSVYIENTFQIAKRFLPTLRLGNNSISYQDANSDDAARNVSITVRWKESSENNPPNKVHQPVFPKSNMVVDSLYFAFEWFPASDNDDDTIEDYEFFLADHPEMNYPLSPNFNQYVSAFGEGIKPIFKVKETGWLNDGKTYYWRVRAKDALGAWGEWSDTWSFTPHGVMRPINVKAEIVEQSIKVSWERNPTGKQPDFYKIYASNEMYGFSPSEITFFSIAKTTEFVVFFDKDVAPFSFFRIAACDTLGQESLISDVISIPYPHMYAAYDNFQQDSIFKMNLFSNEKFYPYYHYNYSEDLYIPKIKVEQKPDWLNHEPTGVLFSTDTELARKILYQDSLQRSVVFSLDDGYGGVAAQTIVLQTTAVNKKPALMLSDSTICEGSSFSAYITSTDGDVAFGDTNYYTILQKPDWLNYDIKGDTVHLFGIPAEGIATRFDRSLLRILAVDTKNDSTTIDFLFHVTPSVRILSVIQDTAIEDQSYSYSFVVDACEKDISISYLNFPQWLQIDEPNRFSGIPDIHHLNDTILRLATYDKVCNVSVEHEVIISIQHVNHPPVITTTELPALQNGILYTAKIEAFDIDILIEDVDLYYDMLPASSWLRIDHKTGELSGTPFLSHFDDLTFEFIVSDKQGASDSKVITILLDDYIGDNKNLLCQVVKQIDGNVYYARVQSAKETLFRYHLFSINGTLLFSSSNQNLAKGTYYLPIDMSKYLDGVYIFVGVEDNKVLHSIKFIK